MPLDGALVHRAYEGVPILLGKPLRQLDLDTHGAQAVALRVSLQGEGQAEAGRIDPPLLTEEQP